MAANGANTVGPAGAADSHAQTCSGTPSSPGVLAGNYPGDVVIDGARHARAVWSYEAPRPTMKQVADRFGFWKDVEVG